ncbi:hypothetical protein [Clostridium sp.]|uniref:hypothetical protein n=1 Tax=Clostridium sp. TaxID=1506 RepID=UPI00261717F0|nr:hypothetical protein [Clostridium sp.]
MILMNEKEMLEKKVVESMMLYGGSDTRTVKLSEQLDLIIVAEQREILGLNKFRC